MQPIESDITAYASSLKQTEVVGTSVLEESDPEEAEKVQSRLSTLAEQFSQLETMTQSRLSAMEDALKNATPYEMQCEMFDKWLKDAEARVAKWEPCSITSQQLRRQLETIKVWYYTA